MNENIEQLTKEWMREQCDLNKIIISDDVFEWQQLRKLNEAKVHESGSCNSILKYIGGVDISFPKTDTQEACAAIVVLELPSLQIVYSDLQMISLSVPYICGFLAFKEAPPILNLIEKLRINKPNLLPQVILVDGNGLLHPRECGLACHLGIKANIPCIGVAKNLLNVDNMLKRDDAYNIEVKNLKATFDSFPLLNKDDKTMGIALKSSQKSKNPIFISIGHMISLDTAVWVVKQCCKFRIPEPTRLADILSRKFLRDNNLL